MARRWWPASRRESAEPRPAGLWAAAGARDWEPTVSPSHLADLLWNMHNAKGPAEGSYPEAILRR